MWVRVRRKLIRWNLLAETRRVKRQCNTLRFPALFLYSLSPGLINSFIHSCFLVFFRPSLSHSSPSFLSFFRCDHISARNCSEFVVLKGLTLCILSRYFISWLLLLVKFMTLMLYFFPIFLLSLS